MHPGLRLTCKLAEAVIRGSRCSSNLRCIIWLVACLAAITAVFDTLKTTDCFQPLMHFRAIPGIQLACNAHVSTFSWR